MIFEVPRPWGARPTLDEIPRAPIVEWYRVDATRPIAAYLACGVAGMVTGMLAVTKLVLDRDASGLVCGAFGILVVVGGGLTTLIGLHRMLRDECYIALRVDGALFVRPDGWKLLRWDEVEDVRYDAARNAVVLIGRDGSEWALGDRFAGIDNAQLAKHAATVRRRALFGMYGTCGCGSPR